MDEIWKTINYAQAALVLAGQLTPADAQEEMVRANLRYARRQMSWWRGREDITRLTEPASSLILNSCRVSN